MKSGFSWKTRRYILAALLAGTVSSSITLAQGPGGPDGPGGGPGGPPGHGRGRPPFGGMRRVSALDLPITVLASGLKLTDDQKDKIQQIQQDFRDQRNELMPRRGPDSGGPPDPATMQANMEKMHSLETDASSKINAVLTSDQKTVLPTLIKNIESLRATGIPAELYSKLNLTAAQKKKIADIAQQARTYMQTKMAAAQQSGDFEAARSVMDQVRQDSHSKAMAVLTTEQKALVDQFIKDHPRPQGGRGFGPPNGHGGPPQDGFGPPPDGGGPGGGPQDGGPPPPDGPPPGGDPSDS